MVAGPGDEIRWPAEACDHPAENLRRLATAQGFACLVSCGFVIWGKLGRNQHLGGKRQSHRFEPGITPVPGKEIDGIPDLDRIAGGKCQRFVHIREERPSLSARPQPRPPQCFQPMTQHRGFWS